METRTQARLIEISTTKGDYPTIMRAIEDNNLSAGDIIYANGWSSRPEQSFCIVAKLAGSLADLSAQFCNDILGIPLLLCKPGWPWGLSDVAGPALLYDDIFAMDPKNPLYELLFPDEDPDFYQELKAQYRAAGLLAL